MMPGTFLRAATAGLVLAVALAGCGTTAPPLDPTVAVADPGAYRLGPNDKVRVTVFGQEQLSGEFAVDGTGQMAFPLVGGIEAGGLTARQLEARLAATLAEGYVRDPKVNVEVMSFRPFYILGEVNNPGQYPFSNGMTALTAVALAGGFTYRGRDDHVLITRTIDGRKQERSAPPDTLILPDDVIRVPERYF